MLIRGLFRDPGAEGGGGAVAAAAPAAAPVAQGQTGGAAAPSAPASGNAQGAPGNAAPAAGSAPASAEAAASGTPAPFKSALAGLPDRGTAEYFKAFNALDRERQTAIEAEVLDREMNPAKYQELDKDGAAAAAAAAMPTGDDAPLGWSDEQLAALDPHTQKSIQAMQEVIDQVAPYVQDGKLKEGMQVMVNDPIIKARMAEIARGDDPYAIPDDLEAKFDPAKYITPEDLANLDLQMKPKESRELLAQTLQKAYEDGAKNASMKAEYEKNGAVAEVRRIGLFQQQLGQLMTANPSLKSDKPFNDASHPLHPYIKWAGENLGDDFLESHGQEVGYAAFLAAKGKMQETMQNVAKTAQLTFIRAIENGDRKVAMMKPGGPAMPTVNPSQELGGVDPQKYLSDMTYRRNAYNAAKPEVRRRLETLASTGKL